MSCMGRRSRGRRSEQGRSKANRTTQKEKNKRAANLDSETRTKTQAVHAPPANRFSSRCAEWSALVSPPERLQGQPKITTL